MQLSAISQIDGKPSMVVDYYPIKDSTQFVYKVVRFQGVDTMSQKCITKRDFDRECAERIGMGYTVTGFNTDAIDVNPMAGAV